MMQLKWAIVGEKEEKEEKERKSLAKLYRHDLGVRNGINPQTGIILC